MPISPDTIDRRTDNSYDFVRFLAACCVMFSHHFDLAGFDEPEVPGLGGRDFGELGVEIFFCLSGFLICHSLTRSTDWVRFFAARFFRIFPNLAFVLVVTSLATLLWYRNGANIGAHVRYVADNLVMFVRGVTQTIPGVFVDAHNSHVNEPLWTLPYELWCYVLLAALFFLGRRFAGWFVVAAAFLIALAWSIAASDIDVDLDFMIGPLESEELFRLGAYFLSGAVLGVFWRHLRDYAIPLGFAGLALTLALRNFAPLDSFATSLALAAAVVGLGSSVAMAWFARGGDASYGMYVFGWPVAQFSVLIVGGFWSSMLIAFAVTIAIGYATWHGFERRAMAYPARLANALRRGGRQPSGIGG